MRPSSFDFLSQSIPIYPQNDLSVHPVGKAYNKIVAPFQKSINGRAIAKFFVGDKIFIYRMWFKHNKTVVEINNKGNKLSVLCKDRPIRILDLCSVGYYKVNYQRLIVMAEERFNLFHYCKQSPSKREENAEQYHRMSDSYTRARVHSQRRETDPYPWLALDDPC